MPDTISSSGDTAAIDLTTVNTGTVDLNTGAGLPAGYNPDSGVALPALTQDPSQEFVLKGGISQDFLSTGIDQSALQGIVNDIAPLVGGVQETQPATGQTSDMGGGALTGGVSTGGTSQPVNATQAVQLKIHSTVVQPLQPCQNVPLLKLVFVPVDPHTEFERSLRREMSIPAPKKQQMTLTQFMNQFNDIIHTGDPAYIFNWYQILPVLIAPQDTGSVTYTSSNIYSFSDRIYSSSDQIIDIIGSISQITLQKVNKAVDILGGTTDPNYQSIALTLQKPLFFDVNQATGQLIGKDPVAAGIFTGA